MKDNDDDKSPMTNQENSTTMIDGKLARAWRRERAFVHLRGAAHLLIWLILLAAVDFAMDWSLNLSARGRMGLLAVNVLILAVVGYLRWFRHVKRYDPVRTALEVETRHPQLKSIVVSYVQLCNRADADSHMSVPLVQAMCQQAAGEVAPLDFGNIVHFGALRPLLIACVAVLLAGGLAAWRGNELFKVFVGRMLHPATALRYPTNTLLEPVTRDAVVQEGRSFTLSALAGGVIPKEAIVTIRPIEGDDETVVVPARKERLDDARQTFTYPMAEVYRSFTYTFRIGDAVSDPYTVTVVPPPRVKASLIVTYPEYTHRPPSTSSSLTLEVLEGSRLSWLLEFDRPLAAAEMILDGDKTVSLSLEAEGRTARLARGGVDEPLARTFNYSFRWKDAEHGFSYAPAAQYTVQVVPDRAPRVALSAPLRDGTATAQKVVNLRLAASDDYGLSSAAIVYSVENVAASGKGSIPETRLPITTDVFQKQPAEATAALKWPLLKSIPDLAPGDVVRFAVEVTDNRPGKPATTRSETRRMSIVTPAEYADYVARQKGRLLAQIRELHAVEKKASETLDEELKNLDSENGKNNNKN